ncbi:DUF1758 domain-containing protein [Caerostris darwini]|uniref:DUF1758 domain-containing protein n=1 Tax=Caerostris darwini TaxID=1538125 RepID=A0AAV4PXJ3_9ARAC|nr:DUF1758 domain-containing protein [Caerostris darwini]
MIALKKFQPTPYECLDGFRRAQKLPSESYVQFALRPNASFEYYCQLHRVNYLKSFCDLTVLDKIVSLLALELMPYIGVKQGESYFKPQPLGHVCDINLSSRIKFKPKSKFS